MGLVRYAPCLCDYCTNNDTVPERLRPWFVPSKAERVEQITRMVHDVVVVRRAGAGSDPRARAPR